MFIDGLSRHYFDRNLDTLVEDKLVGVSDRPVHPSLCFLPVSPYPYFLDRWFFPETTSLS